MADAPLTVTVTHMRESNGNEWWSAHLYRATGKTMAFTEGYEFYQSPIKGRVDYEADCMRKLLDPSLPDVDILAYDTDAPATPSPPVAAPPATPVAPSDFSQTTDEDLMVIAVLSLNSARTRLGRGDLDALRPVIESARNACIELGTRLAAQPQPQPAQPLMGATAALLQALIDHACEVSDHTPQSFSAGVMRLADQARAELKAAGITAPSTPTPPGDAPCSA